MDPDCARRETGWMDSSSAPGTDPRSMPKTADGMREAWSIIEATWSQLVERARPLGEALLHERVDGEWSFVETLRHLVFAHDRWVRRTIVGDTEPFNHLG